MCIIILSQRHPDYKLIVLSNRDEYFKRKTIPLHRWPSSSTSSAVHVQANQSRGIIIAGQDAERGGTWLGISSTGKFSALTNFRTPIGASHVSAAQTPSITSVANEREIGLLKVDEKQAATGRADQAEPLKVDEKQAATGRADQAPVLSRGSLPTSYLTSPHTTTIPSFLNDLLKSPEFHEFGGFSLLVGDLTRLDQGISVISNQSTATTTTTTTTTTTAEATFQTLFQDACGTVGLSNSLFDEPWLKTQHGIELLNQLIDNHTSTPDSQALKEEELVSALFGILSTNGMQKPYTARQLPNSIFIPKFKISEEDDGWYGTRQQTVILLNQQGSVEVIERAIDENDERTEVRQAIRL